MSLNLDELRPTTAYRVACGMFALFLIAGLSGVTYSVGYCLHQFGKPNGLPVTIDASNVVFPLIGAVIGFSVAVRFGRYARRARAKRGGSQ